MQLLPSADLQPYIKHYLFLASATDSLKQLRLFSDGHAGMVFCLSDSPIFIDQAKPLPPSFLYGQVDAFKDLYIQHQFSMVAVVFQPDGLFNLLGIAAHELWDSIIPLPDIVGHKSRLLQEALLEQKQLTARLSTLNTFFRTFAQVQKDYSHTLVAASLAFIAEHKGSATVQHLVKHTGYTERHIERAFRESIGLSPKKFAGIVQLHAFLKLLQQKAHLGNMTSLSAEAGYFDQSHLIRSFKRYTGITPSTYLHQTHRLAINFMEFQESKVPMSGLYNLSK